MGERLGQTPWRASGFFGLRTPLLPADTLRALGEGLEAPAVWQQPHLLEQALERDAERLRERLRALVARPEIREALWLGSPGLEASLEVWLRAPLSPRGQRVERGLVRYVMRMAGRATPLGLFAGVSVGTFGPRTQLRLEPLQRHRRRTRPRREALRSLTDALAREPTLRQALVYRPNSSLVRAQGRVRYYETPSTPGQERRAVSVEETDYLRSTLERAAPGARLEELAAALVGEEVSSEDARAYIEELVDSQVLVAELEPPLTGPEPLEALVATLRECGRSDTAERLERLQRELSALDDAGVGQPPSRYQELAQRMEASPGGPSPQRPFSVDLFKPAPGLSLRESIVPELLRGIEVMRRLHVSGPDKTWTEFRQVFEARYGQREVPLVQALEELPFGRNPAPDPTAIPWLQGAVEPAPQPHRLVQWGTAQDVLLRKLQKAWETGAQEVQLEEADTRDWPIADIRSLPDAWSTMFTLLAASPEAVDRGDYRLSLAIIAGPAGVRQLKRFCSLDESLRRHVERHLRAEEALKPEALFVDIVHAPAGGLRTSDIVQHPVMRAWELPYLGRSGAPREHQLPVEDLRVSVREGRFVLRSQRLGVEVCPRLPHADNFRRERQAVYRFLCEYQAEGHLPWLFPHLGPLSEVRYLPRLVSGRVILLPALWRLEREELERLELAGRAERFHAVQLLRRERRLPRMLALSEVGNAEQTLTLDLDNVLSVEGFLRRVRRREQVLLREVFLGPESLCVSGPEGHFVHELVVPFVRAPSHAEPSSPSRGRAVAFRQWLPGEQWLHVRLHGGSTSGDEVVRTVVVPVARRAMSTGAADGWFFERAGEADWHLRVSLWGEPQRLLHETLPALQEAVAREVEAARLSRLSVHPFARDDGAWGGEEAARRLEQVFHADSEACADMLERLPGDEGRELRWWAGLVGAQLLLGDWGLRPERQLAVLQQLLRRLSRRLRLRPHPRRLGAVYRQRAHVLQAVLGTRSLQTPLAPALEVLRQRSLRLAPLLAELRELERGGRLTVSGEELVSTVLQGHVNRMIQAPRHEEELAVYDFLARHHRSHLARAGRGA